MEEKVNPRKRCSFRRRWAREKICPQGEDGLGRKFVPKEKMGLRKGCGLWVKMGLGRRVL
jgi:hypothetical protein